MPDPVGDRGGDERGHAPEHDLEVFPDPGPVLLLHPETAGVAWELAAEQELRKIPFFVRGKARRNTEMFAQSQGLNVINIDTLYEAKAHYAR